MSTFDFSGSVFDPIERTFDFGEGVVLTWRELVAAPTRDHVHAMLFAARLDARIRRRKRQAA